MLKKTLLAGAALALTAGAASAQELNSIGVTLGSLGNPFFVGYDIMQGTKPENPMVLMTPTLITADNVADYKGWTSAR